MTSDICIIGGAAMGSALALFLKQLDPGVQVLVIEPDPSYERASSARSASSIRQQFSSALNIQMSQFGLRYITDAAQLLAVPQQAPPDLQFCKSGYLFLATAGGRPTLAKNIALQSSLGAEVISLEPSALAQRMPWLCTDGISLASLGLSGEGWFDGYSFTQALRSKAASLGVQYIKAAWLISRSIAV
jgi:FAD-dependent oxidoreductase domain-containing protein 1